MSDFDPRSREAYYAAGVLTWLGTHQRKSFAAEDLSVWTVSDTLDFNAPDYLGDERLLTSALSQLEALGALARVEDRYGPLTFVVTGKYGLAELASLYPDSPFDRSVAFGPRWIKKALVAVTADEQNTPESLTAIGASVIEDGEIWEPLPIDRGAPRVEDAVAGLKVAIDTVERDNGFSVSFPAERDNLLSHANSTLTAVANGKVTRFQVRHNIIGAGKWLNRQFPGSELGDLGSRLIQWGELLLADVL